MTKHLANFFRTALLIAVFVCNDASAGLPPDTSSKAARSYFDCLKSSRAHDYERACLACERALRELDGYEDKLKVGIYVLYGDIKSNQGDFSSAEKMIQNALALSEKLEGKKGTSHSIATLMKSVILMRQGKFAIAEPLLKECSTDLEIACKVKGDNRVAGEFQRSLYERFICLIALHRDVDATAVCKKLVILRGRVPTNTGLQLDLASGAAEVGDLYNKQGNCKIAQAFYEKSVLLYKQFCNRESVPGTVGETLILPDPPVISAMRSLGEIYERTGRVKEGKSLKSDALNYSRLRK